jgi:hypothetical protein
LWASQRRLWTSSSSCLSKTSHHRYLPVMWQQHPSRALTRCVLTILARAYSASSDKMGKLITDFTLVCPELDTLIPQTICKRCCGSLKLTSKEQGKLIADREIFIVKWDGIQSCISSYSG